MKTLNIEPAEVYPAATEHVNEMIAIIEVLLKKDIAYVGDDKSVYFSIKKFKHYGKLAHINVKDLKAGARVKQDEYEKDAVADFALWKAWDEADGEVHWESPFGRGRPGWHIECSAMSMKHLSNAFAKGKFDPHAFETIDIHTGGIDNKFPHHEDEVAQSEAATEKKFVNYWLHAEYLIVDGKKMSKSLGNFYTLRDLIKKGYDAKAIRYALFATHYKKQFDFTFTALDQSKQAIGRLQECVNRLLDQHGKNTDVQKLISTADHDFVDAISDDLNMPGALSALFTLVKTLNAQMDNGFISKDDALDVLSFFKKADTVLSVLSFEKTALDKEIETLIQERELARKKKDFKKADEIRKELEQQGILLDDTKDGVRWKKA